MSLVGEVLVEEADGTRSPPSETPLWKAQYVFVKFTCPICGDDREEQFNAPLDVDERVFCDVCENTYFIRRGAKKGEDAELVDLIEDQLVSNSTAFPLVEENPAVALLLATRVQTVLFSGLAVIVGTSGTTYGLATIFWTGDLLIQLGMVFTAVASLVGISGVLLGGGVSFLKGYTYYRREDVEAASFAAFVNHVGRYYHEEPFRLT